MIYAIGGILGCHINPAITISMLATQKIGAKDSGAYIAFQCIGAVMGTEIVYLIATGNPSYSMAIDGLGQNQITPSL